MPVIGTHTLKQALVLAGALVLPLSLACGPAAEPRPDQSAEPQLAPLIERLASGDAVFGIFSGDKTPEQGRTMGQNRGLDFVFYSLEQGPFDIPTLQAYMEGVSEGSGAETPHPFALRIPPIRDDPGAAVGRVKEAVAAGVSAVVFPHVVSAADAAVAVSAMGPGLWPGNPAGGLLGMLIVEDREGVEHVSEIVKTPGVSVVFAGPGDLRRAYEGDLDAVENAIQTVLAACEEQGVPCGITAGADDIAHRIEQGFRVFIVTEGEAVPVGRAAAGRE